MIYLAGEPDDMWWNGEVKEVYLGADLIWKSGPTIEVNEVTRSGMYGSGTFHSLITLSPPPGEVWQVEVEGRFSGSISPPFYPRLRVGSGQSGDFRAGTATYSGEVTSADSRVGVVTASQWQTQAANFAGTVTVTKP